MLSWSMDTIKLQVREGCITTVSGIPPKLCYNEFLILIGQLMSRLATYDGNGKQISYPHPSYFDTFGQYMTDEEPEDGGMIKMAAEFVSPAVENFTDIDGKTYATGKGGKGLYRLVDAGAAYFPNEAIIVDENFRLKKGEDPEMAIRKVI